MITSIKQKWLLVSHQCFLPLPGLYAAQGANHREYHFVNQMMTWGNARQHCREKYDELATVRNQDENDELHRLLQKAKTKEAWIGLYDDMHIWKWSLNSRVFNNRVNYNSWGPGEPSRTASSRSCVTVTGDGDWSDVTCDLLFPSVCYNGEPILLFLQTSQSSFLMSSPDFSTTLLLLLLSLLAMKRWKSPQFIFRHFRNRTHKVHLGQQLNDFLQG